MYDRFWECRECQAKIGIRARTHTASGGFGLGFRSARVTDSTDSRSIGTRKQDLLIRELVRRALPMFASPDGVAGQSRWLRTLDRLSPTLREHTGTGAGRRCPKTRWIRRSGRRMPSDSGDGEAVTLTYRELPIVSSDSVTILETESLGSCIFLSASDHKNGGGGIGAREETSHPYAQLGHTPGSGCYPVPQSTGISSRTF